VADVGVVAIPAASEKMFVLIGKFVRGVSACVCVQVCERARARLCVHVKLLACADGVLFHETGSGTTKKDGLTDFVKIESQALVMLKSMKPVGDSYRFFLVTNHRNP
jgi:hypothetical protein